jgi:hypothetical protein
MGKVSRHLEKVHSHLAAHHSELAACYKTVADFGKASGGKSDMEHGDALRECLGKIAAQHEATSAFHTQMAGECQKAIEASDLEKSPMEPLPSGLSRVAPERTPTIRAVPRVGAPQMAGECQKAIEASDLEKSPMEPLPSGLSRVAPERTPTIRAVPRVGAPQMPIEKAHAGKIGGIDFFGLEEMDSL